MANNNCDMWSVGMIVLEVYLSLYVHKKDCKEMVHNLYLNKLSYQSRCILLNQVLDNKKNPIICSLIKEMLKDASGDKKVIDEKTAYEDTLMSQSPCR